MMEAGTKHWVYNPKDGNPCITVSIRTISKSLDLAQIVEKRKAVDDPQRLEYYVHYVNRTPLAAEYPLIYRA